MSAGEVIAPAVTVLIVDAPGEVLTSAGDAVTISLAGGAAGAELSGTLTVTAEQGVATFSDLSVDEIGSGYELVVAAEGFGTASSDPFDVVAPLGQLVFLVEPPASGTAGEVFTVEVELVDDSGAILADEEGDVTLDLASGPEGAVLGGALVAPLAGGVAIFPAVSLDEAGTGYALRASAAGRRAGTSAIFAVVAGAPFQLAFLAGPADVEAGAVMEPVRVAVLDELGNIAAAAFEPVTLVLNDQAAVLRGTTQVIPVDGVATFDDLVINELGSGYVLLATSGVLVGSESDPFGVVTAPVAMLLVGISEPVVAGEPFSLWVSGANSHGVALSMYLGTVTITSTDELAELPPTYSFREEDYGDHTFVDNLILHTVGPQTITVTDVDDPSIKGTLDVEVLAERPPEPDPEPTVP